MVGTDWCRSARGRRSRAGRTGRRARTGARRAAPRRGGGAPGPRPACAPAASSPTLHTPTPTPTPRYRHQHSTTGHTDLCTKQLLALSGLLIYKIYTNFNFKLIF